MNEAGVGHDHSFFLVPPEKARTALETCIAQLAAKYGGPVFVPHLTVLGNAKLPEVDLSRIGASVAHRDAPEIHFEGVHTGTAFFKTLYLSVPLSQPLFELNKDLTDAARATYEFAPHISLAYGNYDAEALAAMKAEAEAFFAEHPLAPAPAAALELWHLDGAAGNWKRIEAFPFES